MIIWNERGKRKRREKERVQSEREREGNVLIHINHNLPYKWVYYEILSVEIPEDDYDTYGTAIK